MSVTGTLVEDKMRRFKGECEHFSFNKCPIYTHDGASAKFSPNSQEMDNSAGSIPGVGTNFKFVHLLQEGRSFLDGLNSCWSVLNSKLNICQPG